MRTFLWVCASLSLAIGACDKGAATKSSEASKTAVTSSAASGGKAAGKGSPGVPGTLGVNNKKLGIPTIGGTKIPTIGGTQEVKVPDNATSIPRAFRGEYWHAKNAALPKHKCNDEEAKVLITSKSISWTLVNVSGAFTNSTISITNVKGVDDDGVFTLSSGSKGSDQCGREGSSLEMLGDNLVVTLDCGNTSYDKYSFKATKKAPAGRGEAAITQIPAQLHGKYKFKVTQRGGGYYESCKGGTMTIDAKRISVTGAKRSSCNTFMKFVDIKDNAPHYELTPEVEEKTPSGGVVATTKSASGPLKVVWSEKQLQLGKATSGWGAGVWKRLK
jgi:hypothetical protein